MCLVDPPNRLKLECFIYAFLNTSNKCQTYLRSCALRSHIAGYVNVNYESTLNNILRRVTKYVKDWKRRSTPTLSDAFLNSVTLINICNMGSLSASLSDLVSCYDKWHLFHWNFVNSIFGSITSNLFGNFTYENHIENRFTSGFFLSLVVSFLSVKKCILASFFSR